MAALAGANQIYGAGMIESGVTFDGAQLVIDDEIAGMIKHCVMGMPVSDETLAVEDIARVGAFGDFLSLDATLKHMRSHSQPRLMDRRVREDWQAGGATDLYARARARALEIVEGHRAEPLDPDAAQRIRRIVEGADRERGVAAPARS
jgi:trimethylamine---corrinoid protein Co-methyltransferase